MKRKKGNWQPKARKGCDNCANCLYICDGDYACMAEAELVIVKEKHLPNENYCFCGGKLWDKEG